MFPTYRAYTNDSALLYEGLAYCSFVLLIEILNITHFTVYWGCRPKTTICVKATSPRFVSTSHFCIFPFDIWNGDQSSRRKPWEPAVSFTHTQMRICCGLQLKESSVLWRALSRRKHQDEGHSKQKEMVTTRWRSLHQQTGTCLRGLVTHTPTQTSAE